MKFIAAMMVFTSLTSFAATTDNLLLQGQVNEILSIDVREEILSANLNLSLNTNAKVAEVEEISNNANGYKVSITSANQGVLKRVGGTEVFPYKLRYDGVLLDLSAPVDQDNLLQNNSKAVKNVRISYQGRPAEEMVAGSYSDTVTFTIATN